MGEYLILFKNAKNFMMNLNFEASLEEYQNILNTVQNSTYVLKNIALCYMKLLKYNKACQYFKKARKINKGELKFMSYYSTCLWHLNDQKHLTELSEQFFKSHPHCAETWVIMGNAYSCAK